MKELFSALSSVSNFFNEKRFIFGAEQSNNEPKIYAINREIEFPELVIKGEKPRKTIEFPEMVIKAGTQEKGRELVANSKLNKLMDKALIEGKSDTDDDIDRAIADSKRKGLKKESTKNFSGLGSPDELVGRLGGGNKAEEAQVLDSLGNHKDEKGKIPPIASLDKDKNK